jgi:L-rhamnose isomerase / sugar isomerase
MKSAITDRIVQALDTLRIELPSWGFSDSGTRFGKYLQAAAASTLEEKFADAGEVHALTGACPTIALHVQWDLPNGAADARAILALAERHGVQPGSINPNFFQDQHYKYGSFGNPDAAVRRHAIDHALESLEVAKRVGSRDLSCWFADGSNYPGTANIRQRKQWFTEGLATIHQALGPAQRLLVEYKPFEPAFYHTDIGDWGMALILARAAGSRAKVLVDTGHHYQGQNIEQIVTWLLAEQALGGFHFNDRRYADDDLTLGSIDPYQIFRIFHAIRFYEWETGAPADIAYMVDQSHNLKGKIEAMIQTVCTAQELYARAALVDHERLEQLQQSCALMDAEETLRGAFWVDTRGIVAEWRESKKLPADPLLAFRQSGYLERVTRERRERNVGASASYA